MRRWSLLLSVAILGTACGGTTANLPKTRMTAKDIVKQSSPAIVRIEAGDAKVGTGFVVDKNGIVATNLHVVEGEADIKVRMFDGAQYSVMSIAGVDRGHDLALLRIQPKKPLPTLVLGDSSQVSAGDQIIAIGNPLGVFDYSVSAGLISQVRPLSSDLTILQISAPISPGSSGGPLFNQYGEVVGVTTAIITQGQNINLAVPTNYLRPMIARPVVLGLAEFAKATKDTDDDSSKPHADADIDPSTGKVDTSVPPRDIPDHPLSIWDGCGKDDVEQTVKAIDDAIAIGAKAYNKMTVEGFEECYRIYEGTALKLEQSSTCKGVRVAFGDGLLRAGSVKSYKDKAWAMRDAFDGLINAAIDWCKHDTACSKRGFGQSP
jgi:hypothetical protein